MPRARSINVMGHVANVTAGSPTHSMTSSDTAHESNRLDGHIGGPAREVGQCRGPGRGLGRDVRHPIDGVIDDLRQVPDALREVVGSCQAAAGALRAVAR